MKTEKEIRKRLKQLRKQKGEAKRRYSDEAYIVACRLVKEYEWILEEEK